MSTKLVAELAQQHPELANQLKQALRFDPIETDFAGRRDLPTLRRDFSANMHALIMQFLADGLKSLGQGDDLDLTSNDDSLVDNVHIKHLAKEVKRAIDSVKLPNDPAFWTL